MNIVEKYGGQYLRNMEDLSAIADWTAASDTAQGRVIVAAAMQEIAAAMSRRAEQLGPEIGKEHLDMMFSAAEQQTAALLAAALQQRGVPAEAVACIRGDSLDMVDRAEGRHELKTGKIREILQRGGVAVVAGFQGIGTYGQDDVKGRYGAAATAAAIAADLGCECCLYGNTQGIRTRENGRVMKAVSYEEAMELILLGDSDLESRAVELARAFDVKLYVGPAFEPERTGGTYIMDRSFIVQEGAVAGIAVSDNIVIYTLKGMPATGERIAELFEVLGDLEVNIDMISQQTCSSDICAVSFSCERERMEEIDRAFEGNQRLRDLEITRKEDLSLISLVGAGMASHTGVAGKVFGTLAAGGIRHYNITTSEISISAAVDTAQKAQAVVALSEAFQL
ncbi:MAG: ACT domain-containing protein [Emergencia sp.]